MTTILFDKGHLAADRAQVNLSSMLDLIPKAELRMNGRVVFCWGGTIPVSYDKRLLEDNIWLKYRNFLATRDGPSDSFSDFVQEDKPNIVSVMKRFLPSSEMLFLTKYNQYTVSEKGINELSDGGVYCAGTGGPIAHTAYRSGMTVKEAVIYASRIDALSGGPVDHFDVSKLKKPMSLVDMKIHKALVESQKKDS